MSATKDRSTRLLCASILLGHGDARGKLVSWLDDKSRAVALELGLDLRLCAQVARYAERLNRRYWWMYFAAALPAFLAWANDIDGAEMVMVLCGMIAAAIWLYRHIQENSVALLFGQDRFSPAEIAAKFPAELEPSQLSALPAPDQNFFVFGGFNPFVGAGHDLGGWSVAVALDKAKEHYGSKQRIEPFVIAEVYETIDEGLERLAVRGIEKKDCFFALGTDLRSEPSLLPDIFGRPIQHLDAPAMAKYYNRDDEKVRHYRCYRIVDWGGDLALSYYFRCSLRGNTLFVETKRFLLTPLASNLRGVDSMTPLNLKETLALLPLGAIMGPLVSLVSPLWVAAQVMKLPGLLFSSEERERREKIEKNPLHNYGAVQSLRQVLSGSEYRHYFQKIDGDFYNKLFEREVLDTLVEFLDEHGIDTSDLKERQTTILNSGVIVQGGDVKAENLAVGAGSQAINQVRRALGAKAAAKGAGE